MEMPEAEKANSCGAPPFTSGEAAHTLLTSREERMVMSRFSCVEGLAWFMESSRQSRRSADE